jgi:hypothetical protein
LKNSSGDDRDDPADNLTTNASCSTMSDAEDVGNIVEWKDDGMAKKTRKPNQKMQAWIEARKRHQ